MSELRRQAQDAVNNPLFPDMHTHLFAPEFGAMNLWSNFELLNYHYLIVELLYYSSIYKKKLIALNQNESANI